MKTVWTMPDTEIDDLMEKHRGLVDKWVNSIVEGDRVSAGEAAIVLYSRMLRRWIEGEERSRLPYQSDSELLEEARSAPL